MILSHRITDISTIYLCHWFKLATIKAPTSGSAKERERESREESEKTPLSESR